MYQTSKYFLLKILSRKVISLIVDEMVSASLHSESKRFLKKYADEAGLFLLGLLHFLYITAYLIPLSMLY